MEWSTCHTPRRIGDKATRDVIRSHYQRDYDRLIFSSAFRRLQSKTQVFPLPGSTFVHNRLTHSLEVASVGRSLGTMVGQYISTMPGLDISDKEFYRQDLANIIAAGCLAHDIGNPAFGHSGEDAISNYFTSNQAVVVDGTTLKEYFSTHQWTDLTHFEGNANALRVLAQDFNGKAKGGMGLTISTLASILKYPCNSTQRSSAKHRKKYSYFAAEQDIFDQIAAETNMHPDQSVKGVYHRHPFVYLVEAADDICYRIVDLEDAHRLNILPSSTVSSLLLETYGQLTSQSELDRAYDKYKGLEDINSAMSYLRAKVIGALIAQCTTVFKENADKILAGTYRSTLLDDVDKIGPALQSIEQISIDSIYNHYSVVEIEIAGYNVMSELLNLLVPAVLAEAPNAYQRQALKLLPQQYKAESGAKPYQKVLSVLDHVSAMTDLYATDQYRKIKGIEIGRHR